MTLTENFINVVGMRDQILLKSRGAAMQCPTCQRRYSLGGDLAIEVNNPYIQILITV
jgi:hypothetical protein